MGYGWCSRSLRLFKTEHNMCGSIPTGLQFQLQFLVVGYRNHLTVPSNTSNRHFQCRSERRRRAIALTPTVGQLGSLGFHFVGLSRPLLRRFCSTRCTNNLFHLLYRRIFVGACSTLSVLAEGSTKGNPSVWALGSNLTLSMSSISPSYKDHFV